LRGPVEPGQYVSLAFGERCREVGIDLSMTEGGSPLDNAVAESFFATLKRELVNRCSWPTRADLRVAVFEWIEVVCGRARWSYRRRCRATGLLLASAFESAASQRRRKGLGSFGATELGWICSRLSLSLCQSSAALRS